MNKLSILYYYFWFAIHASAEHRKSKGFKMAQRKILSAVFRKK